MVKTNNKLNCKEISFLETEKSLSQKTGIEIKHPIKVFNLKNLGIDQEALLSLLSDNITNLSWDEYDFRKSQLNFIAKSLPKALKNITKIEQAYYIGHQTKDCLRPFLEQLTKEQLSQFKQLQPSRRRSICQFLLTRENFDWTIERIFENNFTQQVDDYRVEERVFHQSDEKTTKHPAFQSFLIALANLTLTCRPEAKKLKMVAHEMSVIATNTTPGNNSPEGIHQDGSDFIVSAMVVKRQGILEGRSHIYGPDKSTIYLDYILKPGEGIFQADKGTDMWHRVTSFYKNPAYDKPIGERSILGFDIDIIG